MCPDTQKTLNCRYTTWPVGNLYAVSQAHYLSMLLSSTYTGAGLSCGAFEAWWLSTKRLPITEMQTEWFVRPEQDQQLRANGAEHGLIRHT